MRNEPRFITTITLDPGDLGLIKPQHLTSAIPPMSPADLHFQYPVENGRLFPLICPSIKRFPSVTLVSWDGQLIPRGADRVKLRDLSINSIIHLVGVACSVFSGPQWRVRRLDICCSLHPVSCPSHSSPSSDSRPSLCPDISFRSCLSRICLVSAALIVLSTPSHALPL